MVNKVITRICGGLGNQMFTYAVGERLARRYGVPLEYDLVEYFSSKYVFKKGISTRTFQLRCFKGPRRYCVWPLWRSLALWGVAAVELAIGHELVRRVLGCLGVHLFRSSNIYFPDPKDIGGDCRAVYSTWLMFSTDLMPPRKALVEEFALAEPLAPENAVLRNKMRTCESVSLHVRRTDYLTQPTPWNLSKDYYLRAIDRVNETAKEPHWFVFSDDLEWSRKEFAFLPNVTFVDGNSVRPWEDLELMKNCRHHVMANSTFSWWGSYLANDPNGLVVCPRVWPCCSDELPPTFLLPNWVRIS